MQRSTSEFSLDGSPVFTCKVSAGRTNVFGSSAIHPGVYQDLYQRGVGRAGPAVDKIAYGNVCYGAAVLGRGDDDGLTLWQWSSAQSEERKCASHGHIEMAQVTILSGIVLISRDRFLCFSLL